jgi:hypothetical protein
MWHGGCECPATEVRDMWHEHRRQVRIAFLIGAAALAIALAVMEALASHTEWPDRGTTAWAPHVQQIDRALRRNRVNLATREWHEAYVAALGSGRWEGMLAVGDAALRIGDASRGRMTAASRAHHAYLSALFRARDDRSLEGVLRAGEAFAALGDTALAIYCLRIAEPLLAVEPGGPGARRFPLLRGRVGEPVTAERGPEYSCPAPSACRSPSASASSVR